MSIWRTLNRLMSNVRNHKNGGFTYITPNTPRIGTAHTDLEAVLWAVIRSLTHTQGSTGQVSDWTPNPDHVSHWLFLPNTMRQPWFSLYRLENRPEMLSYSKPREMCMAWDVDSLKGIYGSGLESYLRRKLLAVFCYRKWSCREFNTKTQMGHWGLFFFFFLES